MDPSKRLFTLSIGVFFIGGYLTSLIGLLVPRMTLLLSLDYPRALLIQTAFHLSYLIFAIPVSRIIMRIGYMRSIATGLGIMAMACAMMVSAFSIRDFALILLSSLCLSAGITFLQIAGNTVVTVSGEQSLAPFRLNLLQSFNSAGTVIGPLIGAPYILGATANDRSAAIAPPFILAIMLLLILCGSYLLHRTLLGESRWTIDIAKRFPWRQLAAEKCFWPGVAAIFAYVGAEVTIGSLLTNFLTRSDTLALGAVSAGAATSLYWGGAMVGRALGAFATRWVLPHLLLAYASLVAITLVMIGILSQGPLAGISLLCVGFCNSIMYPTIYALALPRSPALATPAAMLLCMAVVGGAVIPLATGFLADILGLANSLILPAACYGIIALFTYKVRKDSPK